MHRVSKHGWGGMLSDFPKGGASQSGFHVSFGSSGLSDGWPLLPEGVGLEHMGASDVFFQLGRGSVAVTEFSLLWEGMPAPPGERGPPPPGVYASQPAFISLCHLSWGAADKSGFLYSPLLEDLLD